MGALSEAGFSPSPDFRRGSIGVFSLPEFKSRLVFSLTINMDEPFAKDWNSLWDGCSIASGRISKGAPHSEGIYSRKKASERARQEKWAAVWSLYDAGIIAERPGPDYGRWQDIVLP